MILRLICSGILSAAADVMTASHVSAQQHSSSFNGKVVTIAVGGGAGSGIDNGARMLARYMGKYLPGNPDVRVQLMPGAGGVRLLEHLYSVAPRDGTYIGAFASGPILEPLISQREVKYKTSDFTAVGALDKDASLCVTWHQSPIKTIEDAKRSELTVAGTGAASSTDIFPVAMNAALGTRFRVITGYVDTQQTIMALERGETEGRCGWSWSSIRTTKPDWVREGKLNFLVQFGLEKHPELSNVPLVLDLIQDGSAKQMMRVLVTPQDITRPYLAPPGLSINIAADVRAAFMHGVRDEGFRGEFEKSVGELPAPTSGEDMQKLLASIYATPHDVIAQLKDILHPRKQ